MTIMYTDLKISLVKLETFHRKKMIYLNLKLICAFLYLYKGCFEYWIN